jgi:lipopolysaccharide export system protein LptA
MKAFRARAGWAVALAIALIGAGTPLGAAPTKGAGVGAGVVVLPGADSKQPVSIEADKLVYFDKEQKAIYSGKVIAIQGDTKMTCSTMTIYMEKSPPAAQPAAADPTKAGKEADVALGGGTSHVTHMDAVGPVTVVSKTQVATGDAGSYDKAQNKVWLTGNVTLSDGGNVTKGEKLTYDLSTGQATVDPGPAASRVKGLFTQHSDAPDDDDKTRAAK